MIQDDRNSETYSSLQYVTVICMASLIFQQNTQLKGKKSAAAQIRSEHDVATSAPTNGYYFTEPNHLNKNFSQKQRLRDQSHILGTVDPETLYKQVN